MRWSSGLWYGLHADPLTYKSRYSYPLPGWLLACLHSSEALALPSYCLYPLLQMREHITSLQKKRKKKKMLEAFWLTQVILHCTFHIMLKLEPELTEKMYKVKNTFLYLRSNKVSLFLQHEMVLGMIWKKKSKTNKGIYKVDLLILISSFSPSFWLFNPRFCSSTFRFSEWDWKLRLVCENQVGKHWILHVI